KDPEIIVRERGWELLSDPEEIARAVQAVYAAEGRSFQEARAAAAQGNARRLGALSAYLVGKVLAATGGRADPRIAGQQVGGLISSQ
ncbi:MAG: Asp-tRNA(Asn)/Glu-tRNA(Gln) amidotransferase GatCAB subunit B, partial [Treponema sp.]|nr:Asp-tRNA(Asn)/Glu-tRNA(Gln) amidotransferase GatCAB subunit B [Treponema sp.]